MRNGIKLPLEALFVLLVIMWMIGAQFGMPLDRSVLFDEAMADEFCEGAPECYRLDENGNSIFFSKLADSIEEHRNNKWVIQRAPEKSNIGEDVQKSIRKLYNVCVSEYDMTHVQAWTTQGMADHESGGTWSPTVKGDNGCSTGIGQWNSCPGSRRYAAPTIDGQIDQLCREMKSAFDKYPFRRAIQSHNWPRGAQNGWENGYVERVLESRALFQ